ncbi:MAG: arsenosugar biosynthesis radical SAM protein ArsS [Proteobacteria bacterium]|jgi:radical SAM/Cys-rich protein|nr:arsenosugar biosynthesis radical SAM protein ArsS [Pseudomonadota bacterium]
MHATLPLLRATDFPPIRRTRLEVLQVNLGYLCNQQCLHCHVNAGPKRKEIMTRETVDDVLTFLSRSSVKTLDLTGGAPELNPHFRYLVGQARARGVHLMDRCNLTVLNEPEQDDLASVMATHQVEIFASLPCYLQDNVDGQRGKGVYAGSIEGIRKLNAQGYGQTDSGLILNLVYNPTGPYLPPPQCQLEADYKRELGERFGIRFNHLLTIANMPIKRFGSMLISKGQFDEYMQLLKGAHVDANLDTVMCRNLISVDWQGYLYDCDFNQMLKLPLNLVGKSRTHIRNLRTEQLDGNPIVIADHCYGCTAGQGSSCGGALNQ